jgi:hypothetical protein
MSDPLIISNDGPRIVETNFWETRFDRDGLMYLSINARALRLLLPRNLEEYLADMASAKLVILSRPRNPGKYAMEILFDDGTDSPFALHLDTPQIDRLPPPEDDGRADLECTVWTQPRRGVPHEALRRPAAYRVVPRLPWLKAWGK